MNEDKGLKKEVEQFIREEIDTVPHLEALLLLRSSSPKCWAAEDMAAALYVQPNTARDVLHGLVRRQLAAAVAGSAESFCYRAEARDALVGQVELAYKRNLVQISRMIHSKAAPAIREFAQAFRFTKDRE